MLKTLQIKNFAIIDQVTVTFGPGLNILSGETGAGKSIIMDALQLILGGRASSDLVRRGAEEASVEALFDLEGSKEFSEVLHEHGLESEEGELIVRRIVSAAGKNRIFVNGSLVNMGTLSSITSRLVDLCSQHDQQLLARGEEQLLWVDRFGELEKDRAKVRDLWHAWREKQKALDALSTDSSQRAQRIDFLRFQLTELQEAGLENPEEDAEIENELKVLANSEALWSFSEEAEGVIHGGDGPALAGALTGLIQRARALQSSDARLSELVELLQNAKISLDEAGSFVRTWQGRIHRDEGRLEELHSRAALLGKMKRKYGPQLSDVIVNREKFRTELSALENHDSSLESAREEAGAARELLGDASGKLTRARKKAADLFAKAVVKELADLNMDRARFEARLSALDIPAISGMDAVEFQISANPGEPLGALNKIASGGELSRVMLAIHNVVSSRGGVGVYLFDEVDAGIGGTTAVSVGTKLQRVSLHNQVICITHLPQVASFANAHFRVEKRVVKRAGEERTVVQVVELPKMEREGEIARMLGGMGNDKEALANARAMLLKASKGAASARS